jgi:hypothetical protein
VIPGHFFCRRKKFLKLILQNVNAYEKYFSQPMNLCADYTTGSTEIRACGTGQRQRGEPLWK